MLRYLKIGRLCLCASVVVNVYERPRQIERNGQTLRQTDRYRDSKKDRGGRGGI